ncbi:MAG: WG repeat-containing protein [Ruminococcus sp.]|nr:WG repeat-containing protein [Ruminococcus sp.]
MKKLVAFLLVVVLFCFSACGENNAVNNTDVDTYGDSVNLTQTTEYEERETFLTEITSTGQIPYDKFNHSSWYDSYTNNDYADYFETELFRFYYDGKYGYCDEYGNIVLNENYDQAGVFSEDKAVVKVDDEWKVIDINGNVLTELPEGYAYEYWNVLFQNGKLFAFEKAYVRQAYIGLSGVYDLNVITVDDKMQTHEFTIDGGEELTYRAINTPEFSGVLLNYCHFNKDTLEYDYDYKLVDCSGNVIWQQVIPDNNFVSDKVDNVLGNMMYFRNAMWNTPLRTFIAKNGYMNIVDENKKWGLIELATGEVVLPCSYDYVGAFSDDVVPVCSYGKWGYADVSGNFVLNPSFSYTGEVTNDRAFAITSDDTCCVIDKAGNIVANYSITLDEKVNLVYPFSEETGLAVIIKGYDRDSACIISDTGELLLSSQDFNGLYFSDDFIFMDSQMYRIEK